VDSCQAVARALALCCPSWAHMAAAGLLGTAEAREAHWDQRRDRAVAPLDADRNEGMWVLVGGRVGHSSGIVSRSSSLPEWRQIAAFRRSTAQGGRVLSWLSRQLAGRAPVYHPRHDAAT